jgi:hypothetical protein
MEAVGLWPELSTPAFSQDYGVNPCSLNRNGPHWHIELRPNDLASPRISGRTDDFSPNLDRTGCAGVPPSLPAHLKEESYGTGNREVVQQPKRLPRQGCVRAHQRERAGMHGLNEGQKVSLDVVADRRTGKTSSRKSARGLIGINHGYLAMVCGPRPVFRRRAFLARRNVYRAAVSGVSNIASWLHGQTFATGLRDVMNHRFGDLRAGNTTLPTRSGQAVAL